MPNTAISTKPAGNIGRIKEVPENPDINVPGTAAVLIFSIVFIFEKVNWFIYRLSWCGFRTMTVMTAFYVESLGVSVTHSRHSRIVCSWDKTVRLVPQGDNEIVMVRGRPH
jgi:hypothetical protein